MSEPTYVTIDTDSLLALFKEAKLNLHNRIYPDPELQPAVDVAKRLLALPTRDDRRRLLLSQYNAVTRTEVQHAAFFAFVSLGNYSDDLHQQDQNTINEHVRQYFLAQPWY